MKLFGKFKKFVKPTVIVFMAIIMLISFGLTGLKDIGVRDSFKANDESGNGSNGNNQVCEDGCAAHGDLYFNNVYANGNTYNSALFDETKSDTYISDITNKCQPNGYLPYNVYADKTNSGAKLAVKVDGSSTSFDKGLYTPTPQSVIYDISGLDYKYFFSYIGIQNGTNVNARAVFSVDLSNSSTGGWVNKYVSDEMTSNDSVKQIRIEKEDFSFIRLRADFAPGTRTSAAAVWADAKFTDRDTNEVVYLVKSVAEYDEIIKTQFADSDISNKEYELTLLQRNYVSKFGVNGHVVLHNYINANSQNAAAFNWLFNNLEVLRMYTTGGAPDNANIYLKNNTYNQASWSNSLRVLTQLYNTYKDDLNDDSLTELGTRRGDVYQKMMISIALTYSKRVRFWIYDMGPDNTFNKTDNDSNAIDRYAAFKKIWLAGKLDNRVFENIEVEEMRYIMTTLLPDNEIEWLLDYWTWKGTKGPYSLMKYLIAYEFWSGVPHLYDPAKKDYYYEKYKLDGYGIEYKKYYTHAWMMFETGGVCWNMSNIGSNMTAVWGHPSTPLGQTGYVEHVAYADYYINSNGDGYWALTNDVFGWANTNFKNFNNLGSAGGWYTLRAMNDWGTGSYASSSSGTYLLLSQAAINDFANYERAKELTLLASVYEDDLAKQEQVYRQALASQKINLDAWLGLINNYVAQGKTGDEFVELAREAADALKYYPLPMYDMLRLIGKYASAPEYKAILSMIQADALTQGSKATEAQVLQSNVTRTMANYLLGKVDTEVATFEFDGDGGGTLSLGKMYSTSSPTWEYSLDGGATWTITGEKSIEFSEDQIAKINVDDNILVHIIGTVRNEQNTYVINITKANPPNGFYANDWENKVYGLDDTMDWRYKGQSEWTAYKTVKPDLFGDKEIEIRRRAVGTTLASELSTYSFTSSGENNPNKKYIPVSELSIYKVSSEATSHQGNAENIIDGNYNTRWHSDWNGNDKERYIIIEFSKLSVIIGMDYIPAGGGNGKILNGRIYGSATGEYWTELANVTWANNENIKSVDFEDNTLKFKYIKIVGEKCSGSKSFMTGRMFNFYHNEEASADPRPVAGIEFDVTTLTNGNVMVSLVNPSTSIIVTNNGGKTKYTFTKNGSFTFDFKDVDGNVGHATASVDWIDKTPPTAIAEYSTTKNTKDNVTVTLSFDEDDVVIKNNNGKSAYTFTSNGKFTFYFVDKAGNEGSYTAEVRNIFNTHPTIEKVEYSALEPTKDNVTVTFYFDRPVKYRDDYFSGTGVFSETYVVTFTENKSYIYMFYDELENGISRHIAITNIDRTAPIGTIVYSTTNKANKVTAYISFNEDNVTVTNNNGKSYYTFTENGSFVFEYTDRAGNTGKSTANVNWVDHSVAAPEIKYSTTNMTNQNVVASLVINGSVVATHEFSENGSYTFNYNYGGQTASATAFVSWIDKTVPKATITYSTRNWTKSDVTVTLTFDESDVEIINNGKSNTRVFTKNGTFVFEYKDSAGNVGRAEASVNNIFRKPPTAILEYSTTNITNSDVTVRVTGYQLDEELNKDSLTAYMKSVHVTSNYGNNYYVFKDNGEFTFNYIDGAGNEGSVTAVVDWIDKEPPIATIEYSDNEVSRGPITATVSFNKPNVTIDNNNGSNAHTFDDNGSFTFKFTDVLGNVGSATAVVTWINKNLPVVNVQFNISEKTDKDVVATITFDKENVDIVNNQGNAEYTFTENGSFTFEYVYDGNSYASYTVDVTWIKKTIVIKYFDGDLVKEDEIAYGSGYQILFAPDEKEGQTFSHWASGDKKYYEGDILNLEDDLTLTAVYVNNGGGDNSGDGDDNTGGDNTGGGNTGSNDSENRKKPNAALYVGIAAAAVVVIGAVAVTVIVVLRKKKND